jgi:LDH2 family malate/lactate/ureidoglycolate dehydrogenase
MLERFLVPKEDQILIESESMTQATKQIFLKMGLSEDDAQLSSEVLMTSDLRGCESHGVSNMLPIYVDRFGEGAKDLGINPTPNFRITRESPTTANIDGDDGLGLHVLPKAMEIAIEKAEKYGSGSVAVHNSRHIGMLAYHSMMALEHDMIGLTMTAGNSMAMVPTHGAEKRLSTNPWAYAVPADKEPPFVFDVATTQVAGNKLSLAKRVGAKMDSAWITDSKGNPILNEVDLPDDREDYMMLPFGGTRENGSHKGYGYAAVAEIFSDILSGMGPGFLMPPNTYGEMGHFVQVIKIDGFIDVDKFKKDMDLFLKGLAETKPIEGQERVVYAGLPEFEETQIRLKEGIPYHYKVIDWFENIKAELNLDFDLKKM